MRSVATNSRRSCIQIVDVADFAAGVQFQFGEVGLQQNGVEKFRAHEWKFYRQKSSRILVLKKFLSTACLGDSAWYAIARKCNFIDTSGTAELPARQGF